MNKKISFIIPTYLEEKLLANLLANFTEEIKNKYDLELIVSDGGSFDSTLPIAKQYADIVVEHTKCEKQNIAQGRNCGAAVASADIFVFFNADCEPKDLEYFLKYILKLNDNTNFDAIACRVRAFPSEELLRDKVFYFFHNNYVRFLNIIGVGMGRGECQIIKRAMFEKIGGYNFHLAAGEDFDLYRRISKNKGKIHFIKDLVVYESTRRYRKYGYLKTLWYWTINSLTVIFCNKSVSKEWEAIR